MEARSRGYGVTLVHVGAALVLAVAGVIGVRMSGGEVGLGIVSFYLLVGLLVAVVPPLVIARKLTHPMRELEGAMSATRVDGDLARSVAATRDGMVGPAATAYNELITSFRSIVSRILFTSEQVAKMADRLIVEAKATD
jgi:methyl-accepting chemotaxis protein